MSDTTQDNALGEGSPPIIDIEVLEAAKENIQPLARGRRVTALSDILSTPHAQREGRLAAARNRHRINVEIALGDEDDDPLEAYSRFVSWTVESYPQGLSSESGLLELLEEATRTLKDDRGGRWRDDLRYLKLWVLYASYVERPATIYKFLLVNEIGTSHALFYEEYATALERAGQRAKADETYLLGIARHAVPLEHLENRHRDFQKRMMTSPSLPSAPSPPSNVASTSTRRPVLATTSSTSRVTRSSTAAARDQASASRPRVNARVQVFVDPSGTAVDPPEAAPWPDIGTRHSRIKENIREVRTMGGTTLKQSRRTASGSAPKMSIYRDPEPGDDADTGGMPPPPVPEKASKGKTKEKPSTAVFRDDEAQVTPMRSPGVPSTPKFVPFRDDDAGTIPATPAPEAVMKDKTKGLAVIAASESEALRKDPFKNYSSDIKPADLDG